MPAGRADRGAAGWAPRSPGLAPSLRPSLTQVDEAHDHVGIVKEGAVLRAGQRRGGGRRATPALRTRAALRTLGQGVVEVQHEARSRRQPSRRRGRRLPRQRPGPVGQTQHREDLPLHLPLLVRLQPAVEEARGGGGRRRLPALGGQRGLGGAAGAAQQRPAAAQPGQPARHGARPAAGGRRPRSPLSPGAARRPPALPPPGGLSARPRASPPAGHRAAERPAPAPAAAQVRRGRPRPAPAAQLAMPLPGGSAPGRGGCGRRQKEQREQRQTFRAAGERASERAAPAAAAPVPAGWPERGRWQPRQITSAPASRRGGGRSSGAGRGAGSAAPRGRTGGAGAAEQVEKRRPRRMSRARCAGAALRQTAPPAASAGLFLVKGRVSATPPAPSGCWLFVLKIGGVF